MADFSLDIPTPTPKVSENSSQIFRSTKGLEWRVFVQAGPSGISIRRQLIKTLGQTGATIDTDPRAARVILVEPTTKEGRTLVRSWGSFADKVVLRYNWVEKSLAAGYPLDESANWGGCLVEDDGLPIEEDYEDEERQCFEPAKNEKKTEAPSSSQQPHLTAISTERHSGGSHLHALQSNAHSGSPGVSVQSTALNGAPQTTPETLAAQAVMLQNLTAQASAIFNVSQPMQTTPLQLTPEQQQLMVSLLASQQFFGMPLAWNQSTMPTASSNSFGLPSSGFPAQSQPTQAQHTVSNDFTASSTSAWALGKSQPASSHKSTSNRTPSQECNSRSTSLNSPSFQSSQPSHGSLFVSKAGCPLLFFVQINVKDRRNIVGKVQKGGGKIVSDHVGADYAILSSQADDFNTLLSGITAAGKQAHNVNFIHACVEANKIIDASQFAFDSAGVGRRKPKVTEMQEVEGSPTKKVPRKRTPKDSPASGPVKKARNEHVAPSKKASNPPSNPATPQGLRANLKVKTEKKSPKLKSKSSRLHGPRSPTPPPESTRRSGAQGFYFTQEENQYTLRYLKILLDRDPEITVTALSKALHSKMNHHTLRSWSTHLGQHFRTELAELRKRASIAYRKRQNESRPSASTSMESPPPATPKSAKYQNSNFETLLEEDLETVSRYFAFGGGDSGENEEDELIWRRLTDQVKCKTATSWQGFYGVHSEEVMKRFAKLVSEEE